MIITWSSHEVIWTHGSLADVLQTYWTLADILQLSPFNQMLEHAAVSFLYLNPSVLMITHDTATAKEIQQQMHTQFSNSGKHTCTHCMSVLQVELKPMDENSLFLHLFCLLLFLFFLISVDLLELEGLLLLN